MAETLQEFLISVRYSVDQASQNQFLAALKRVAGSVAGVGLEIAGLAGSIMALGKAMAETGEQFYFMSMRLGSGVNEIQGAAFALSNFGMSGTQALASMESFSAWTRNMGPAATGFLRSLGVTARDTVGELEQLGPILKAMGGTAEMAQGTDAQRMQYVIAKQYAQMMGINEQMMLGLTSGQFKADNERAGLLQRLIWGVNTKAEADAQAKKWADQSNAVMRQFREMGLIFETYKEKFGLALFQALLPFLEKLNKLLVDNRQTITTWIGVATSAISGFLKLLSTAIDTFQQLPTAFQHALEIFMALPALTALAKSPIAWLITALTTLLLLLESYQVYKAGGKTLIDWGSIENAAKSIAGFFQPLTDLAKMFMGISQYFDDWIAKLTGVHGVFNDIALTVALIGARMIAIRALGLGANLLKSFLGLGGGVAGGAAGGAAAGAGAGAAAGVAARIGAEIGSYLKAGLGIGLAVIITTWLQDELNKASASMVDWITGRKPGETAKRNAEMNAAGEKQFTDFLHGVNDWMANAIKRGLGVTLAPPAPAAPAAPQAPGAPAVPSAPEASSTPWVPAPGGPETPPAPETPSWVPAPGAPPTPAVPNAPSWVPAPTAPAATAPTDIPTITVTPGDIKEGGTLHNTLNYVGDGLGAVAKGLSDLFGLTRPGATKSAYETSTPGEQAFGVQRVSYEVPAGGTEWTTDRRGGGGSGSGVAGAPSATATGGGEVNDIPAFAGPGAPPKMDLPGDTSWGDYGTRANNPGNMNYAPGQGAAGQFSYTDPQTGGAHTMGVFATMQEGVAAAYRLMLRNQAKYGKTIAGALHGWAENSYIGPLAKQLGISPDQAFDIAKADPEKVERLLAEQFRREGRKGSHTATPEQILGGINLGRDRLTAAVPSTPPLGSEQAAADTNAAAAANGSSRTIGAVNNNTTVNIAPGPHAEATAEAVAKEQTRVHEHHTRTSEGALAA